ncbi:MAG: hypothetical protein M3400_11595 [Actinomycetota bacterium]|nr:hypothetical protein [Actinomycetota bacterium]
MTRPNQPAPGEDIAKGSDGHPVPGAVDEEPGDPDPRDPFGHDPDSAAPLDDTEAPEPLEPPD